VTDPLGHANGSERSGQHRRVGERERHKRSATSVWLRTPPASRSRSRYQLFRTTLMAAVYGPAFFDPFGRDVLLADRFKKAIDHDRAARSGGGDGLDALLRATPGLKLGGLAMRDPSGAAGWVVRPEAQRGVSGSLRCFDGVGLCGLKECREDCRRVRRVSYDPRPVVLLICFFFFFGFPGNNRVWNSPRWTEDQPRRTEDPVTSVVVYKSSGRKQHVASRRVHRSPAVDGLTDLRAGSEAEEAEGPASWLAAWSPSAWLEREQQACSARTRIGRPARLHLG